MNNQLQRFLDGSLILAAPHSFRTQFLKYQCVSRN
jgi:hypothetical protein